MVAILFRPTSPAPSVSLETTMVWPFTRPSLVMISLILREKMSEPPPAEEVQVQVTVLLGVKVSEPPPEVPELPEFPPQAVRARSIRAARVKAISFFIVRSPSFQLYFHLLWKSN